MTDLIYSVGDIHGRLDALNEAITFIEKDADGEPHKVVFLGDYIDRGPDSKGVINRLIAGSPLAGVEWICLAGNHESMMLQCFAKQVDWKFWYMNGGLATLESYGHKRGEEYKPYSLVLKRHIEWLAVRPPYHLDGPNVFVHAGLDNSLPLSEQLVQTLLWKRYKPNEEEGAFMYKDVAMNVFHGHDIIECNPKEISPKRFNLDTGAYRSGDLGVARIAANKQDPTRPTVDLYKVGNGHWVGA